MNKLKDISGMFLIAIGLVFNKWILSFFPLTGDFYISRDSLPNPLINIILIIAGILLIRQKFDKESLKKTLENYKFISITFFTIFLVFFASNILCYLYFSFISTKKAVIEPPSKIESLKLLKPLYPALSRSELMQLLHDAQKPQFTYSPFVQFRYKEFKSRFLNINKAGFRYSEGQGPWPPDPKNINVFVFGGSTTFGVNLADNQTIPSYLQKHLSKSNLKAKTCVYNFGRPAFTSSLEEVHFMKRIKEGFIPDIAVFIDGLNDCEYIANEPIFTNNFKQLLELIEVGHIKLILDKMPLLQFERLVSEKIKNVAMPLKENSDNDNLKIASTPEERLNNYFTNKKIIESVSKTFNIKTLFVWQPVSFYKYDLKYHIFTDKDFLNSFADGIEVYNKMGNIIKSKDSESNFFYLADLQKNIKKPLYIDDVHYSAKMSEIVAKAISDYLISNNYLMKN